MVTRKSIRFVLAGAASLLLGASVAVSVPANAVGGSGVGGGASKGEYVSVNSNGFYVVYAGLDGGDPGSQIRRTENNICNNGQWGADYNCSPRR